MNVSTVLPVRYKFQPETLELLGKVPAGSVSRRDSDFGVRHLEPVLVILDCALRYAKAYRENFENTISNDYVARPEYLSMIQGARALLSSDGAASWEQGKRHDSKDNATIESLFWECVKVGGFEESDLD